MERLLVGIKVLDQPDVAHYLLSLGVVKPRDVIDDGFTVVDASRRNRVFVATTRSGPTFVVKQAADPGLAHEAAILRLLAGAPELAPQVPAVVHEEAGGCLVLRTAGGGRTWTEHGRRFPRTSARALGRTLAALHGLPVDAPPAPGPPWALSLAEPPNELVRGLSAAAQDVVARVQSSEFVCSRLDALGETLADDALVHGDLRWDNCLDLPGPGRRRTRVLLVDWESAGRAEAAFDAGSVLAEYLRAWVGSVPMVQDVEPARLVARARLPLSSIAPAVQAFWSAYRDGRPRPPALARVIELAAVRLLQIAVEVARGLAETTAHVVTLLQLAGNMLRRPEIAAGGLLGLRA